MAGPLNKDRYFFAASLSNIATPNTIPFSGGTAAATTITSATITGWQAVAGWRGAHVARPAPGHAPASQSHQHRYQAPGA